MTELRIKALANGEVVKRIPVSPSHMERVLRGLLRQMDTTKFVVDDSDFVARDGEGDR